MKYTLLILLTLSTFQAFSQSSSLIHVGNAEKLTITAGAILHADGLSLKPSEDFSLSNNTLNRVSNSTEKLDNHITRVYQFINPTPTFSGNLRKIYLDSELNGLEEQSLQLFVFNSDKWYRQPTLNDISINSLTTDINQLPLSEISSAVFKPQLIFTTYPMVENSPIGIKVANFTGTSQNVEGNAFVFSLVSGLGSSDNTSFTIKDSELLSNTSFDFEKKKAYSVRVRVTDVYGRFDEKIVSINISDINEAPTKITASKLNIYEGNNVDDLIGLLTTTDEDAGDAHTYSLVSGTGSTDNAAFKIVNGQLRATQSFVYNTRNSYSIRIRTTDNGGLTFEQAFTVSISQKPVLTGTGNETFPNTRTAASAIPSISLGYSSDLYLSGADIVSYSWSPASGLNSTSISNPIATPKVTTTYTVEVTNRFGSKTSVSITVEVREDFNVTPSNILSPNGDGENDFWIIENLDSYPTNKLVILDRSGKVLYSKTNYTNDWNGQFNGTGLPEGTYYYVITFNNGQGEKRGSITIIN